MMYFISIAEIYISVYQHLVNNYRTNAGLTLTDAVIIIIVRQIY